MGGAPTSRPSEAEGAELAVAEAAALGSEGTRLAVSFSRLILNRGHVC